MIILAGIIGWFVGDFIIGGILFSIFGNTTKPNKSDQKIFGYIGKISGAILAMLIFNGFK